MKVFISFDTTDAQLAYRLRDILKEKDIDGYIFELDKQYDSTLHHKITSAIDDSKALVAVLTKNICSRSLHEEIGYAIASKKSVIIMIEQDADDGVLSHEREKEVFTREDFDNSCNRVRTYLKDQNLTILTEISTQSAEKFLQGRNLVDDLSEDFGLNNNSKQLKTSLEHLETIKKPFVLFSTCPTHLLDGISVTSSKFSMWLEEYRTVQLKDFKMIFLNGFKKIDLGSVAYYYDNPSKFTRYLEFNENGFVEQGFTQPLIYSSGRVSKTPFLHLCWLTGALWAFLSFCKQYYDSVNYNKEFDIILSIHDIRELMLIGFGGKMKDGRVWTDPASNNWDNIEPRTKKLNLQIKKRINTTSLTPNVIEIIVREFSDKLSNVYGFESARCYNHDGTLNYNLLSHYN